MDGGKRVGSNLCTDYLLSGSSYWLFKSHLQSTKNAIKKRIFFSLSLHRRASRKVDDGEEPLLGSLFLFQSLIFWPPISIFRRAMSYLKNDKEGMDWLVKKCNVYSELWIYEVGINQHLQFRFYEKPLCLSSSRSAYLSIAMPTNTLSYEELLLQSAEGQEGEENASAQQQQLLL